MQREMQNAQALTGQQIPEFLNGSEGIALTGGVRLSILRIHGAMAGRAGVCGQGEEGAGLDPQVSMQGHRPPACPEPSPTRSLPDE